MTDEILEIVEKITTGKTNKPETYRQIHKTMKKKIREAKEKDE